MGVKSVTIDPKWGERIEKLEKKVDKLEDIVGKLKQDVERLKDKVAKIPLVEMEVERERGSRRR